MGGELAQGREWNHNSALDWNCWDSVALGMLRYVEDLLHLYKATPALWKRDFEQGGFEWVDFRDVESGWSASSVGGGDDPPLLAVFNMTPIVREATESAPQGEPLAEALNSDDGRYGGSGVSTVPRSGGRASLAWPALQPPAHPAPLGALYLVSEET